MGIYLVEVSELVLKRPLTNYPLTVYKDVMSFQEQDTWISYFFDAIVTHLLSSIPSHCSSLDIRLSYKIHHIPILHYSSRKMHNLCDLTVLTAKKVSTFYDFSPIPITRKSDAILSVSFACPRPSSYWGIITGNHDAMRLARTSSHSITQNKRRSARRNAEINITQCMDYFWFSDE